MSNPYAQFKTDPNAEKGTWISYGDFEVCIARIGRSNRAFQKMMESKTRKYRRQIDANVADAKVLEAILTECIAHTVVCGWKARIDGQWHDGKLVTVDGQVQDATPENVLALLKSLPDLADQIREDANNADTFRNFSDEEDSGN